MQLTFLGKDTVNGGSPTLFATDRNTYVVQGWKVPGDESRTAGMDFPDNDFWLFDDKAVAFNVFTADGSSFGTRLATDPAVVDQWLRVRDQVLAVGIPHEDYHLH